MEPGADAVVYIVEDDDDSRGTLRYLVESVGLKALPFASPDGFIDHFDAEVVGCVLLDLRLPVMSGLDLLQKLRESGSKIPVVILTGYADVANAVRALKLGAYDFFEKPFNEQELLDCVQQAIKDNRAAREIDKSQNKIRARLDLLTDRERQVLDHVLAGKQNKQIARDMGISPKTVEAYRSNLMEKMQARTLAQVVREVASLG